MPGATEAKKAWVARVLGTAIPDAPPQTAPGTARPRPVRYAKLLLQWRKAQREVAGNLASLGQAILNDPEVKADARQDQVRKAVAALPSFIPQFGSSLEDALDGSLTADGPEAAAAANATALKALAAYRRTLAAASTLRGLEAFGAHRVGFGGPLFSALDGALSQLEQELGQAA